MNLNYTKIRKVKDPNKANDLDAGIDFFIPEFDKEFIDDFRKKNNHPEVKIDDLGILIFPHGKVLIPSGIKMNVPKGYALIAFNKSGVSSKYQLDTLACVVDSGYEGEIHISLSNNSNSYVTLEQNQKILQFILLPIVMPVLEFVEEDNLYINSRSLRGEGGFGSSGA